MDISNLLEQTIVFAFAIVLAFLTFIIILIICHQLQKKSSRQQSLSSDQSSICVDLPPSYGDKGTVNSACNPDVRFYNGSESHRYNERPVDVVFNQTVDSVNARDSVKSEDIDVSTSKDRSDVIDEEANKYICETESGSEKIPTDKQNKNGWNGNNDLEVEADDKQRGKTGNTPEDNQQINFSKENLDNENVENNTESQVEDKNGELKEESVLGSVATKFTNWWRGT